MIRNAVVDTIMIQTLIKQCHILSSYLRLLKWNETSLACFVCMYAQMFALLWNLQASCIAREKTTQYFSPFPQTIAFGCWNLVEIPHEKKWRKCSQMTILVPVIVSANRFYKTFNLVPQFIEKKSTLDKNKTKLRRRSCWWIFRVCEKSGS